MALPKISQPLFNLTIPSTGQKVQFRPFTVREEKILLVAQQSKDVEQIITSIKQIINNCIEGVDVDALATFDLEYILINLRSKSVNNNVDFKIRDPDTDEEIEMELDLNDIEVHKDPNHTNIIELGEGLQLVMKYPHIDQLSKITESSSEESMFNVMMECVDSVVNGEEVFRLKEFTEQEVNEFLDSLSSSHVQSIKTFFDTMPKIRYEKKYQLKDGTQKTFVLEGTETFFI